MAHYQVQIFGDSLNYKAVFPTTRYQGSKQKISDWIWKSFEDLKFESFLDAFSGTSCMGFLAKIQGKEVTCNDILKFNSQVALAIIENSSSTLTKEDVNFLLTRHDYVNYPTFIYDNFKDTYYTDEENAFLDMIIKNIQQLDDKYKKAIAYAATGQACLVKRPFNLFHRKNLYVRFADVERSFGNKTTWDKPFPHYFKHFVRQFNASVFSNNKNNKVLNLDIFDVPDNHYDLVYIDTPYISTTGVGLDYFQLYHFLEGVVDYANWSDKIDHSSKHRRLKPVYNIWVDKKAITDAFDRLFKKFQNSILVVSYRHPGIPDRETLKRLLEKYKDDVVLKERDYKYVLSKKNGEKNGEILLIAK